MSDAILHLPTSVDEALLEATRIGMLAEQTGLPLEPARLCAIGEEVFVGGRWLCVARRSVDHVELVDLDTGSTIAWPADQPIERQVRRP